MAFLIQHLGCVVLLLVHRLVVAQSPHNPLQDFCRRWGHSTAQVDQTLYINGGVVEWNPITNSKENRTSMFDVVLNACSRLTSVFLDLNLLYNNLQVSAQGMPQLYANLSKNYSTPSLIGGFTWGDQVNKVLYQFGGDSSPRGYQRSDGFFIYDVIYNTWNRSNMPDDIHKVAWGTGVTVNERGEGYYLGGYQSNRTNSGWKGPPIAITNLIKFDMSTGTFYNTTGPDTAGRAEGAMVFIPASDAGLLIYFGGIMDPGRNGTAMASPMTTIWIYDLASSRWYSQTAIGDVPDSRRRFCAGASWADDHSSWNIYLYGGLGIPPNGIGFDDVYILTLPSFTWIKWWPTEPGPGRPHHSMTCNIIGRTQVRRGCERQRNTSNEHELRCSSLGVLSRAIISVILQIAGELII
jgi:hypothetical protein